MKHQIKIFVSLAVAALMAVSCRHPSDRVIAPRSAPQSELTTSQEAAHIEYPGRDGATALDLLKEKYPGRVQTKQSSFGEFVEGIDGVVSDSKHFWAFFVNGEISSVGAGTYVSKSTDKLSWQVEEINAQ